MSLPKCSHGLAADDNRYNGVWAAPFSSCKCCGIQFPYIDSTEYSDRKSVSRTWTKNLCAGCGGYYVEYGESRYTKIENNDF